MRALIPFLTSLMLAPGICLAQALQLVVDPIVVEREELVTVEVRLDGGASALRGYTLDLRYDRSLFSISSIYEGEVMLAHTPTFFYWEDLGDNSHSVIHVDHAILGGDAGGEGPGALFHVVLRAEYCGVESLWVENALFRDMDNQPIGVNVDAQVEHQACQVPPLLITDLGSGVMRLSWTPALNAIEYHLWSRERWYLPWQYRGATTDTSWVDPETPFLGMRLYQLTLLHN